MRVFAALCLALQAVGFAAEPSTRLALGLTITGSFVGVGWLIVAKRPRNPIGRLFLAFGAGLAINFAADAYVRAELPGRNLALGIGEHITHPAFGFLVFALLLFPNGRLLTPRWRWTARVTVVTYAGLLLTGIFEADFLREQSAVSYQPPVPGTVADVASRVFFVLLVLNVVLVLVAAGSLLLRLRRAHGEERQQVKWFVTTVAFVAVVFAALFVWPGEAYGFYLFPLIPAAAAVGILKYRLYDIDVVIKRTLIYGTLTATLGAAYLALVLLLQLVLSPSSDLAIAGSTLAVAALFRPARTRIQALVNRRFYRSEYDAQRTVEAFGTRLRDELSLDALTSELQAVVKDTMHPAHVTVWLR